MYFYKDSFPILYTGIEILADSFDNENIENEDEKFENGEQLENEGEKLENEDEKLENEDFYISDLVDKDAFGNQTEKLFLELAAAIHIIQISAEKLIEDKLFKQSCQIILNSIDSHALIISRYFFFIKDLKFSSLNKQFVSFLLTLLDALSVQKIFNLFTFFPFRYIYITYFDSIFPQLFILFVRFQSNVPSFLFPQRQICQILLKKFKKFFHNAQPICLQNLFSCPDFLLALIQVFCWGIEDQIEQESSFGKIMAYIIQIEPNFFNIHYESFSKYSKKRFIIPALIETLDKNGDLNDFLENNYIYLYHISDLLQSDDPKLLSFALTFIQSLFNNQSHLIHFLGDEDNLKETLLSFYDNDPEKISAIIKKLEEQKQLSESNL